MAWETVVLLTNMGTGEKELICREEYCIWKEISKRQLVVWVWSSETSPGWGRVDLGLINLERVWGSPRSLQGKVYR